jgi:NHLM bacteriocin system ABC transporter ATP-binding protein
MSVTLPASSAGPAEPPATGLLPEAGSGVSGAEVLAACRILGEHQGIAFRPGSADTVASVAAASGVRVRAVALRGAWWRGDHGPLLAFRGGRAVALLPARPGRYRLAEPGARTRVPVDERVAATLAERAYLFAPPLPRRALRLADLLRAAHRSARREVRTLALAGAAGGALALAAPLATARLVGSAIPAADGAEVLALTGALLAAALAAALFHLLRSFALLRIEAKVDVAVQGGVWDHLLTLPVSFFRRYGVGDLHARAMGVEGLRTLLSGQVTTALLALVFSLFSFGLLFHYSPPLAAVATALLAALAWATLALARRQLREQRRLQGERGRIASLLFDLLGGIHKLRAAGAERRALGRWQEAFRRERDADDRAQRLANLQQTLNAAYLLLAPLVLFAVVGASGGAGLSLGEFLAFNVAFGQLQAAVFAALSVAAQLFAAVPVYERMRPILAARPEVGEARADAGTLAGEIELRNVSFRYDPDGPEVLHDVSIRVPAGEMVALVGPSGSGKSTLLRLMLAFERPDGGTVRIDGRDLTTLDLHSVRRQLGVVLQDGQPLVGTLLENIVGSRNLGVEEAWEAARQVGLEEEIRALPMGMYTFVGDRGTTFSGGQRQRLLLARAVVGRPRILLLDEATSALDNRTQEGVVRSLAALGATRVVVAHRLSTIRHADRIYVMDGGRVAESGTFDALMAAGGLFARMAARQEG